MIYYEGYELTHILHDINHVIVVGGDWKRDDRIPLRMRWAASNRLGHMISKAISLNDVSISWHASLINLEDALYLRRRMIEKGIWRHAPNAEEQT